MASDSGLDSPNSSSSPNKRLKTLTTTVLEPEFVHVQSQSTEDVESSKQMQESDSSCCGICLSEEGKFIRGQIDSCDHHYCFVCIMEWAKIESKCPLCKRRFTHIRRPPKQGVFSCERIVNVPQRDQVQISLSSYFVISFFFFLRICFNFLLFCLHNYNNWQQCCLLS